jgi:peptidoglycan/LPS O-acetylase OafA/YrhL
MDDTSNNFTLIRVMAATAVIYGHSFALSPVCPKGCANGLALAIELRPHRLALWVFFVVSGFLVTASWANRSELASFFTSRFLRIFPALLVCSIVCALLIGPIFTQGTLSAYFSSWTVYEYVLVNSSAYSTAFALPGVWFSPSSYGTGINGSLWTIAAEVRFYIFLGLLGGVGLLNRRALANVSLLVIVAFALLRPQMFELMGLESHHLLLGAFFVAGSLLFHNRDLIPLHWSIALVLLIGCAILFRLFGGASAAYKLSSQATLVYLTMWFAFLPKIKLPFEDYSYGIYLYGFPIQQIVAFLLPRSNPWSMSLVAIPLAWLAGALSWHLIEKPALRLKPARSQKYCPPVEVGVPATALPGK